jgi:hypothetical protein
LDACADNTPYRDAHSAVRARARIGPLARPLGSARWQARTIPFTHAALSAGFDFLSLFELKLPKVINPQKCLPESGIPSAPGRRDRSSNAARVGGTTWRA